MKWFALLVALHVLGCSDPACALDDAGPARECLAAEPNNAGHGCVSDDQCRGPNPGECADLVCIQGVCEFARQTLGRACNGGAWRCTEMMQCCNTANGIP